RGVGNVERGEIGHHGLEIYERFQPALGNLSLIGCVSGIPAGVFENVPLNHRRRDGVGITRADEISRNLIFRRQGAQFRQRFILTFRLWQFEWPIQPDVFRNGSIDQGVQIFEAELAQHLCDLVRVRADMTIGESRDGVWRRDEVTRCRFFLRFCYRFLNRLRLARMHCERLRSAMGASSEVSLMSTGKMPVGPTARMAVLRLSESRTSPLRARAIFCAAWPNVRGFVFPPCKGHAPPKRPSRQRRDRALPV